MYCSRRYTTRNVSVWAEIPTRVLPSWMRKLVKTMDESAHISGFDAYKRVKGREA
jgi:hypothetical protein